MKPHTIAVLLILATMVFSCDKDNTTDTPACITSKITTLQNGPVQSPPAQVYRWDVDGAVYYYITADCCDQYNLLYDTECNVVCAPDGGFTGQGDGQCPQFSTEPQKTLIWEDNR